MVYTLIVVLIMVGIAATALLLIATLSEAMEYQGVQYQIVQIANPTGWKWTVFLDSTKMRTGISHSRAHAVLDAENAIEKAGKRRRAK